MVDTSRLQLLALLILLATPAACHANDWWPFDPDYRTPRAGEPLQTDLVGHEIDIPARDRRNARAISMGAQFFSPDVAGTEMVPFAAAFLRLYSPDEQRRLRAVLAGVVNEVDVVLSYSDLSSYGLEALGHFENNTIPLARKEVLFDREIEDSLLEWGHVTAGLGVGWSAPIPPFDFDNRLEVGALYELGYHYTERHKDTPDTYRTPPDTLFHRVTLFARFDALERNLLELPHRGMAAGVRWQFLQRVEWDDFGDPRHKLFRRSDTRETFKVFAHWIGATTIPGLGDRHALIGYLHAGWMPPDTWDRFSAIRLGGGPLPSESGDLHRHVMPGALFDQFILEYFVLATIEYRFELTFFSYLHLRASTGWGRVVLQDPLTGRIAASDPPQLPYSLSVGLSTGFLWDTMLHISYTFDDGVTHLKENGNNVLITIAKSF